MKPKIYLAGRIGPNDWRDGGGQGRSEGYGGESEGFWQDGFPEQERESYIFTGPTFMGCDHGCAHGATQHGLQPLCDGIGTTSRRRSLIVKHCLSAIDRSDAVFAWLEREAYGTVAEMGYAKAAKKVICVAGPGAIPPGESCSPDIEFHNEVWFARQFADVFVSPSIAVPEVALTEFIAQLGSLCESPIEKMMFDALRKTPCANLFVQQHEIGPYRVDFAFCSTGKKVVVECDGHDFHEKTKEQAEKDKSRDRHLQRQGWAVLRFTGSEIFRDADKCAAEVSSMVIG